jgi:hypothetical protein
MTPQAKHCHGMDCCWDCWTGRNTHPGVTADCQWDGDDNTDCDGSPLVEDHDQHTAARVHP